MSNCRRVLLTAECVRKRLAAFLLLAVLAFSAPAHATISSAQSQITIIATGSQTQFSYPFVTDSASDIALVLTSTAGVQTTIPQSQYTITVNPTLPDNIWSVGGVITYPISGSPLAAGNQLTIMRVLPLLQTTPLSNQGNFYPKAVESALDTGVMQGQQISARTGSIRGTWVTGAYYNYGDIVQDGVNGANSGNFYLAALANTSSTWSADLAKGDWILAISATLPTTPIPLSIANGGTGQITAPAALTALGGVGLSSANIFTSSNSFTGGSIAVPTPGAGDSSTKAASTAFVNSTALTLATGTTAVTQSSSDNTTKVATDAFVQTLVSGAAASIKSVHVQRFTSTGTYTPTTGTAYAIVEMSGGGGGGGGTASGGNVSPSAGSGGYLTALLTAAQIGSSQAITIGAAGAGGAAASNTAGGNGGTTSVGSLLSCTGSNGTSGTSSATASGTSGGTATVSTGSPLLTLTGSTGGGMSNVGGNSVGIAMTGPGGFNRLGTPSPYQSAAIGTGYSGSAGTGYGSGGGGSASGGTGGAGMQGAVIITEYCTQ